MRPHTHSYNNHIPRVLYPWLALIACLFLLASCAIGQTTGKATPAPTRLSTPAKATGKAVSLQQIHMFNASTGWAITTDDPANGSFLILRTTTGATHWQDVTPPTSNQHPYFGGANFYDAMTAWVLMSPIVYRTSDGGKTWQHTQLPDMGNQAGHGQLFFLNAHIGWIMAETGAATGNVAVDILHTSDGGATWKIISVTSYNTASPPVLPFAGDKSGLTFVNETTGWATGFTNRDNFAWLYITHDGGATWQHQDLPLPAQAYQVTTLPPTFFSATDALLPAIIPGQNGETVNIYATHDGGASWRPTNPIHTGWGLIAIADAQDVWIINNADDPNSNQYAYSTLYTTNDGGGHWVQHTIKFSANATMIDFASPTDGWVIDEAQSLYQTSDGGQTWTKVIPTLP
ncbi:MAG TPA: hypothetical protein VKR06_27910 [Ktedonosporobacter sp.]|nr:hypothetical protein [Ktedonosporobacter sp.]